MNWKALYQQAHERHFKATTPVAYRDGHYCPPKYPKVKTANGKNSCIVNFLNWNNCLGDRTNSMGVPQVQKIPKFNLFSGKVETLEKVKWRKQNSAAGRGDVTASVDGVYHLFETKTPHDRLSDEQKDFHKRVIASGGKVLVVGPIEEFFEWWLSRKN